jgi:AraC-like DNA-binding protein
LVHLLTDKSLIVETASAVLQALPDFVKKPVDKVPSEKERKDLAKLIANWGPGFVNEWMRGKIIRRWLEEKNISQEEINEWLEAFTPGMRKHFAVNNVTDPLEALERVKHNLEQELTDDKISNALGWSEAEVKEVFTPGERKHFAVHNINNPSEALKRVKHNLEQELTDDKISDELGWSETEVREVFTPSMRKYFAVHYINNPLEAPKRYIRGEIPYGGRYYTS